MRLTATPATSAINSIEAMRDPLPPRRARPSRERIPPQPAFY
jgi:hypothetical protein